MSKPALVLFIFVCFQASNSAVITHNENDTLKETIQEILQASESICESLQNAQIAHEYFWKNGNLDVNHEINKMVFLLEETAYKYDKKIQDAVMYLARGLTEIQSNWNALYTNKDNYTVRKHIVRLISSIIRNAEKLESWKGVIEEQPFNYNFYREVMPTLIGVVKTLTTLNTFICRHVDRFEATPEEVKSDSQQKTLLPLVRRFLPNFQGYSTATLNQMKQLVSKLSVEANSRLSAFKDRLGLLETPQIRRKRDVNTFSEDSLTITIKYYELQRDRMMYVRKLIETLIDMINILEDGEESTSSKNRVTINNLKQVKSELQDVYTSAVFMEVAQLNEELSVRILKVLNETLQLLSSRDAKGQQVNEVFVKYLEDVNQHIDNVHKARSLGKYRNKLDDSKKPWEYFHRITNSTGQDK